MARFFEAEIMNPYVEQIERGITEYKFCSLNIARLEQYAEQIAREKFIVPTWRGGCFPKADDDIINYFGAVNAINFCFTDFSTGKSFDVEYPDGSGQIWYGSMALAAAFTQALHEHRAPLNAEFLRTFSSQTLKQVLRNYTTPIPMFSERYTLLRALGRDLIGVGVNSITVGR